MPGALGEERPPLAHCSDFWSVAPSRFFCTSVTKFCPRPPKPACPGGYLRFGVGVDELFGPLWARVEGDLSSFSVNGTVMNS